MEEEGTNEFEELLENSTPEIAEISRALCALVRGVCVGATETVQLGWKSVSYSRGGVMKGAICAVCPQAKWVNIQFLQGTSLGDPGGLLEGAGKTMRHVKIHSLDGTDMDALRELILQADQLVS